MPCVEEVFEGLRRTPELYGKVFQGLQLALVRRFPYAVVERGDDDQVTVVVVYHTRRNPQGGQGRA